MDEEREGEGEREGRFALDHSCGGLGGWTLRTMYKST